MTQGNDPFVLFFARPQARLMLLGGFGIAARLHQAALRPDACLGGLWRREDKSYGRTGRTEKP